MPMARAGELLAADLTVSNTKWDKVDGSGSLAEVDGVAEHGCGPGLSARVHPPGVCSGARASKQPRARGGVGYLQGGPVLDDPPRYMIATIK